MASVVVTIKLTNKNIVNKQNNFFIWGSLFIWMIATIICNSKLLNSCGDTIQNMQFIKKSSQCYHIFFFTSNTFAQSIHFAVNDSVNDFFSRYRFSLHCKAEAGFAQHASNTSTMSDKRSYHHRHLFICQELIRSNI